MTIFDKVSEDIKTAMIAKNKIELMALRNIKKELLEAKTSKEAAGNLTDEIAVKVISKIVKQNRDAAQVFTEQNRPELAEEYNAQSEVMQRYLPARMSDEALTASVKELGKVMAVASRTLAGKADGRDISDKVKSLLN